MIRANLSLYVWINIPNHRYGGKRATLLSVPAGQGDRLEDMISDAKEYKKRILDANPDLRHLSVEGVLNITVHI